MRLCSPDSRYKVIYGECVCVRTFGRILGGHLMAISFIYR